MRETIFTLGYQQRSLEEFVGIVRAAHADVVIDVREMAWSHKPGFSKHSLQSALEAVGIEYVHAAFAGNPKWLRENASTHDECLRWYDWYLNEFGEVLDAFEDLASQILAEGKSIVLTCFERHSADCHRSILTRRWAARDQSRKVSHLATEGCPRVVRS